MSDELKPCWFDECNLLGDHFAPSIEVLYEDMPQYLPAVLIRSWCGRMQVRCSRTTVEEAREDAIKEWNTRPVEDELLKKIEQLHDKWESVPWDALRGALSCLRTFADSAPEFYGDYIDMREWLDANEPEA